MLKFKLPNSPAGTGQICLKTRCRVKTDFWLNSEINIGVYQPSYRVEDGDCGGDERCSLTGVEAAVLRFNETLTRYKLLYCTAVCACVKLRTAPGYSGNRMSFLQNKRAE